MKCGYCKLTINEEEQYGVLCTSNIPIHDKCYEKAFRTERTTLKGRLFSLRTKYLTFIDKTLYWFHFQYFMLFKYGKKDNEVKK